MNLLLFLTGINKTEGASDCLFIFHGFPPLRDFFNQCSFFYKEEAVLVP